MTSRAVLIDIGGVLMLDQVPSAARDWGERLGITPGEFFTAVYGGNDDHVLIGRTSEAEWWRIVGGRLGIDAAAIRSDLAARTSWNTPLIAYLRSIEAKIAIVSNAWPDTRDRLADAGLLDLADAVVLSCEVGYAKPDPRIFAIALESVGADALFIDDTPGHVAAARLLGLQGHVHTDTAETIARIEAFVRG